jgi:hypothetical protein
VWRDGAGTDHELLETAGSWSLLLLGFFPSQMERRHNLEWYTNLGRSFYHRASVNCPDERRRFLLRRLSGNFAIWTSTCQRFRKNLLETPLLIH